MMVEKITCWGHENVRATHRSTLEFTKEDYLTPRGDCILCIKADKGMDDLSEEFKRALREGRRLRIVIRAGDIEDEVIAWGDERLILSHPLSMVVRKSEYVDGRTLALRANKAAKDIRRDLVELLKRPDTQVEVELIVE
ncbi:DUF371 domain-containing protein [Palaeococcus ferrophilus]|uniref:DUF371 domain-containing protein n=1 Tax=Palaeococcus ferrophilus TaxID=83868 RepID=UPI00064E34BC|nr:DUF371 domain-containing protein [Palaeococcus ferrophilus]